MNQKLYTRLLLLILFISQISLFAQPRRDRVQVIVTPEETDWTYAKGDRADFHVMVLRDGQPLPNQTVTYKIGPEMLPATETGELTLKDGTGVIKGMKMKDPGFLRCEAEAVVDGKTYRSWGTAGFSPEDLRPVVTPPSDFKDFWTQAKSELAQIPLDAKMTLLPERCTEKTNVYHLSLANVGGSRFYAILCVPKTPGKYPAILNVPGAGARPYYGDVANADKGIITLTVGIHGVPVTMETDVYNDMMRGAISGYWINKLDDRDQYYYKRVYLGCVRAIDYIFSMNEFDGSTLAVTGGSQGGALSIVTAGLDSRVKYLAAFYPALCDLTGYLEGRAGGWPHMFRDFKEEVHPKWKEVSAYYDVVNFARQLNVPGWYSWGFNDNVCPPTSMYAAYNVISAPKQLYLAYETGHWTFPEQQEIANKWLMEKLGVR